MIIKHPFAVYIMMNPSRTTLYVGITNNLVRRIEEHKQHVNKGFTSKFNIVDCVYYEFFQTPMDAIRREKQLKNWKRAWKLELMRKSNPKLVDLYPDLIMNYDQLRTDFLLNDSFISVRND